MSVIKSTEFVWWVNTILCAELGKSRRNLVRENIVVLISIQGFSHKKHQF